MDPRKAKDIQVAEFVDHPNRAGATVEFEEWRADHLEATVFQIDVTQTGETVDDLSRTVIVVWYSE